MERKPDWLSGFPVQIYCNRAKIHSAVSVGDVLYLPVNVPHGAFIEEDCRVIDVFCYCREDYMQKLVEQHPYSVTYFQTV